MKEEDKFLIALASLAIIAIALIAIFAEGK